MLFEHENIGRAAYIELKNEENKYVTVIFQQEIGHELRREWKDYDIVKPSSSKSLKDLNLGQLHGGN